MKKKLMTALALLVPFMAVAAEPGQGDTLKQGLMFLGAGLAIGLAALGTGIGMGRLQTIMFIGLAFIETLALYALLIAIIILFVK